MCEFQGDFGTQKEAAWAISNLTISGRKDQVEHPTVIVPVNSHACSCFYFVQGLFIKLLFCSS